MLRRKLVIACASLAVLGAGALATGAIVRPAAVHAEEFEPLPDELGAVPRIVIRHDGPATIWVYNARGLHAEISVVPNLARRTRDNLGGVDPKAMARALPQRHAAMMGALTWRGSLQLESQDRAYEIGDDLRWPYRGNTYRFRAANGTPMRRLLLVTTHDHRLVTVTLDAPAERNADARSFLDALSGFLAGTLPIR